MYELSNSELLEGMEDLDSGLDLSSVRDDALGHVDDIIATLIGSPIPEREELLKEAHKLRDEIMELEV